MNLLALDTSGPVAGVALMQQGVVTHEISARHGLTHSQVAMQMVDAALSAASLSPADIDLFVAVAGPGSFTGVRICVCAVKAMAHATNRPALAIDALEALAANIYAFDGLVCPILDARRDQIYCAAFRAGEGDAPARVLPDAALALEDFLTALPEGARCLFLGDGAAIHRDLIAGRLGARALFAPAQHCFVRAACACHLASLRPQAAGDHLSLSPIYLRLPQAQRERAQREGSGGDRHA